MMREALAAHVGFPLVDLVQRSRTLRWYHASLEYAWLGPEELRAVQQQKLRRLLEHAVAAVPLYRQRFGAVGLDPGHARLTDLERLPPLTRRDLQEHNGELFAEGAHEDALIRGASSGSTGQPVVFFKDSAAESAGHAAGWVGWSLAGWHPGARYLHIWGNPATMATWRTWRSRAKWWLLNWDRRPAFELQSRESLEQLRRRLASTRPSFVGGYTHAIYQLALHIREVGGSPPDWVRAVLTTAEQLHGFQRQAIEAALGPVFDNYGCAEINGIASQCRERNGYHIHAYHVILETVREEGVSKILVTDLDNYAFPLIRYQVGDLATDDGVEWGCRCGAALPRIAGIAGRESDLIPTEQGGAFLVPSFLGGKIFDRIHGVRAHQVVLGRDGVFVVKLVLDRDLAASERAWLAEYLREYLGERPWRIEVGRDPGILVLQAGKFKIFCREEPC